MQLFNQKLTQQTPNRGFTMIEAVAAMMIITTFIAIGLQLLLAATVSRVVAREKAEVTTWIEADNAALRFL